MDFMVILLALLLLRYFHNVAVIQSDSWFVKLNSHLSDAINQPKAAFFISLILPVLVVILLEYLLAGRGLGLPAFLLNLMVLVYALGRGDLDEEIGTFRSALERKDLQAAYHDAATFNNAHQESEAETLDELKHSSTAAIGYRYLDHYFAVVFWYLLAGAAGSLLYRLLQLHQQQAEDHFAAKAAARFLWILEWLPVRLVGLTCSIVGNFISGVKPLVNSLPDFESNSPQVLGQFIEGALDFEREDYPGDDDVEPEIAAVQSLMNRSLVCMLCLIALWVIFTV